MIRVDWPAYFRFALLILIFPLKWFAAANIAAVFHELCHILVLKILKGNILGVSVYWNGCMIETDRIGEASRFVSILAGPFGSFSLLFLHRIAPEIAICGLIQGIYNLIPLMPLDGGRLLYEVLNLTCPERSDQIMQTIEILIRIVFLVLILLLMIYRLLNPIPGFLLFIWNIRCAVRKFPCKPSKIRVQ